eukprot:symbB.v1.2.031041.t1/scaffold3436.1/size58694/2
MANQVVRRVLVASLIFLLMQPEVLPGFLGPQHDQGRRSKPRAGALTNDVPDVADAPGEPKQEKTETKVQEMLWTALSLAFWIIFYRSVVVEDVYMKQELRDAAMIQGLGGSEIPMFPHV